MSTLEHVRVAYHGLQNPIQVPKASKALDIRQSRFMIFAVVLVVMVGIVVWQVGGVLAAAGGLHR